MPTKVSNRNVTPFSLPFPYSGVLGGGQSRIVAESKSDVAERLGGSDAVRKAGLQLETVASGVASVFQTAAKLFQVLNAPASGAATVHAALAANAAKAFPGPFTNPSPSRNASVTFAAAWDGGDVSIVGTDQFDNPQTESFASAPGTTVVGAKIFKTVSSASHSIVGATANTASIGTGNKLGIDGNVAGTEALLFTDLVAEAVTVDAVADGFTPTSLPNGARDYLLIVNV